MRRQLLVREDKSLQAVPALPEHVAAGTVFHVVLETGAARSLPQHRRYWAMLTSFCKSWNETASRAYWERVLSDLAQLGPDPETVHSLIKRILSVDSTSFERMDQGAANAFNDDAAKLLERWTA